MSTKNKVETIKGVKTIEMPIKQFFLQLPITSLQYVQTEKGIELKSCYSRCSLASKYNDDDVIEIQEPSVEQFTNITSEALKSVDYDICKALGMKINGKDISLSDIKKDYTIKEWNELLQALTFFMKGDIIIG